MGRRPDNQVIGVCRFSYPATAGFRLSSKGTDKVIETLYAPERMRYRFTCFEQICLPSLAAQTDRDFRLVALVGDMMPIRWRRRLKSLRATYPFLEICAMEPVGPLQATRRAFRVGGDEGVPYVTGFRIDDDDAVAVDYVERLRDTADRLLDIGWADAETPAVIGYQTGLYWALDDPALPLYRYSETRPLGQASAMVTAFDFQHNIYRWNHAHLLANARCWTDPRDDMFLRTLHGGNDSTRTAPKGASRLAPAMADEALSQRFGLAPKAVRQAIARLTRAAPE
ncbi:putative rhamnosyl transferase [Roseibacterium sp. SDUM158016]|uniref:putative rhamnosyl transferase n=1 Tax=Roseicyclus sediminis TaxID=2980997 RepID=UPI0021CFC6CC|nr:putative rhamnosyl transferase [Roseibacterium sp. SDUM158016]MCU4655176.1 putative rhamnosyl transferase [Roseibacterium sp. SDUM158016]